MTKQIRIWVSLVDNLIESITEAYNTEKLSFYTYLYPQINELIRIINVSEYGEASNRFSTQDSYNIPSMTHLLQARSVLKQMRVFLLTMSGDDDEDAKKLKVTIADLNKILTQYNKKEDEYLEIIRVLEVLCLN